MKIKFSCETNMLDAIPKPMPSVRMAPNYFKSVKPQIENFPGSSTVKRCIPFLDALSSGFIIPMWCDFYVFAKNGDLKIDFPFNFPQAESMGSHAIEQIPKHPLANKPYGNQPLKLISPWVISTEPGVSCIFTQPLNHMETRFKLFDGVVDTDDYHNNVNLPFLWTGGDGEFFIPKGTPLVQIIPFRRESFQLEVCEIDHAVRNRTRSILGTKMKHGYKDEFWHGKKSKTSDDSEVSVSQNEDHPQVEVDDSVLPADRAEELSSGILEVAADDTGRGFGEGGF